jgi:hypothetical protein
MSPPFLVVLGVGLLLVPVWRLRAPDGRLAAFDQREWPTGRNLALVLLDMARAAGGAWVLSLGMPELPHFAHHSEWVWQAALALVVGLGLVVQTFVWHDEDHVQAPVAFLAGVAAVLVDPVVLLLVGPLAAGVALALRAWSGVFMTATVGTILIGWLLNAQSWSRVVFVGAVMIFPVVVSVLAGRHMGWPRK